MDKTIVVSWTSEGKHYERRWKPGISAGLDIPQWIADRYPHMTLDERKSIRVTNEGFDEKFNNENTRLAMLAAEAIVRRQGWTIIESVVEA